MKQASITIGLYKGHEVHLNNVTPAELLLLCAEHSHAFGGDPVIALKETEPALVDEGGKKVPRGAVAEVQRLKMKYAAAKVNKLFPGATPTLPSSFDEARKVGVQTVLPGNRLSESI